MLFSCILLNNMAVLYISLSLSLSPEDELKKLEVDKGIIIRFVIGHR